ncbi:MAG: His/Gly/Thr/Pro-type tRNA ligase C-terminal domain-containing protein, partial [Candidatus Bathyarchaeia archaeon]
YAWNASWGVSWRLIGALVMVHGDDKGLILPPMVAPTQLILIPIFYSTEDKERVMRKSFELVGMLEEAGVRCEIDDRSEYTPGWKFNQWEMKGVPVRVELGPKDLQEGVVTVARRDTGTREKVRLEESVTRVKQILEDVQRSLFAKAKRYLDEHITDARTYEEFQALLEEKGGFIRAAWCGRRECEEAIKEETGATIRVIPFNGEKAQGRCVFCDREGGSVAFFAKAY